MRSHNLASRFEASLAYRSLLMPPNAAPQPRLEAGARYERTLEGVGCRRLLDSPSLFQSRPSQPGMWPLRRVVDVVAGGLDLLTEGIRVLPVSLGSQSSRGWRRRCQSVLC